MQLPRIDGQSLDAAGHRVLPIEQDTKHGPNQEGFKKGTQSNNANSTTSKLPSQSIVAATKLMKCKFDLDKVKFNRTIPRYAVAFVIGSCDPERPSYRYYIYNVLVATRIMRMHCSKADVIVFIQMSWQSPESVLPLSDILPLQKMGVTILYIPKSPEETFYRTQLDKFRILSLTEYSRVLFMDGDVMPLANLDYLFYLSEIGVFKSNLVIEGGREPANGGFFMLKPGNLEQMSDIVVRRETKALQLPYPHFDEVEGWGHPLQPGDSWTSKQT